MSRPRRAARADLMARQIKWRDARLLRESMTPEQIADERAALEIDVMVSVYVRELEANDWIIPD